MFGYIIADGEALSEAQLLRYRGCYCGLCRRLKERHGSFGRVTLNYDMTFLVLLLSSMYEPEETGGAGRCLPHPLRARSFWQTRFTDYAADINIALAYHNCMDDWSDERRLLSYAEARMLRRHYDDAAARWPRQCAAIEDCMAQLNAIERDALCAPDAAPNCFGTLMGELFAVEEDAVFAPRFRRFGAALGRFIYWMDACVDLQKDQRRGSFNPLLRMEEESRSEERQLALLKMLIGECAAEFEALPLVQDADILRNILYSGVWTRFASSRKKEGEPAE